MKIVLLILCLGLALAQDEGHYEEGVHNDDYQHNGDEEEEHRKDFLNFDLNQDGYVDAYEIREVIPEMRSTELTTFFIIADKDENGIISFDEYLHASLSYSDEQFDAMSEDPYTNTASLN